MRRAGFPSRRDPAGAVTRPVSSVWLGRPAGAVAGTVILGSAPAGGADTRRNATNESSSSRVLLPFTPDISTILHRPPTMFSFEQATVSAAAADASFSCTAAVPVSFMSTWHNICPKCKKHIGPDGHCPKCTP
ncbi:hypothetical protein PsYK624_121520 [Phanerochaete sordida]|uniref:Uncharacterized protein n=1 Tax=Phanerochaete sordida TaxID=48140 RepID=A0A9P3GM42_9APHY|nr:hypothetical protein PsYK624_121520 [Phanerochaete sordida]